VIVAKGFWPRVLATGEPTPADEGIAIWSMRVLAILALASAVASSLLDSYWPLVVFLGFVVVATGGFSYWVARRQGRPVAAVIRESLVGRPPSYENRRWSWRKPVGWVSEFEPSGQGRTEFPWRQTLTVATGVLSVGSALVAFLLVKGVLTTDEVVAGALVGLGLLLFVPGFLSDDD
jgi:hypothetical protein